ncbi:MAG TPA: hypothetical protein DEP35_23150, partial [Deltaproteobacteria bacterium]|nr:hypothetical protein [Deltaproteobacteria bacterium]
RVELQADTNGDHKVDVIQLFENGKVVRQFEDTKFTGKFDRSFVNGQPASLSDPPSPPPLGELGCGHFSELWKAR